MKINPDISVVQQVDDRMLTCSFQSVTAKETVISCLTTPYKNNLSFLLLFVVLFLPSENRSFFNLNPKKCGDQLTKLTKIKKIDSDVRASRATHV